MQRQIRIYLHATDAMGVIYYPNLFIFHTEMIEDFLLKEDKGKDNVYPMRHAEAECLMPIFYGDELMQKLELEKKGSRSWHFVSSFFKNGELVARCRAVHVQLSRSSPHFGISS